MKNTILIIFSLLVTITLEAQITTIKNPKLSPFQKTEIKIGVVDVVLEYSRPSMRGREIFGAMEPYNKVWRTGANKNTKIVFSDYVVIGDVEVPPGKYTIFTKPNKDKWDVYFHTEIDEYGVPDNFDPQNSIVQVTVPTIRLNENLETLAITFDNLTANSATLTIAWEATQVSVPIKIPTNKILKDFLLKEKASLSRNYYRTASILFRKENDSKNGLIAVNEAIEILEGNGSFEEWLINSDLEYRYLPDNYLLKSQILADLNKKKEAIQCAKKSLKITNKLTNKTSYNYYIKTNTENIDKWSKS